MVASLHHDLISPVVDAPGDVVGQGDPDSVFSLAPGQVAGLSGVPGSGLTRLGLSLIPTQRQELWPFLTYVDG